jgi:FAD/FMN-containing dehydrogenase
MATVPAAAPSSLAALAAGFGGEILTAADDSYDDRRRVWNGMIDRRPAVIARCTDAGDVAAALRYAREHDLEIAVRGGGHNVAGTAVNDGGLVVDLSPMRAVRMDHANGTVHVQGGATWGDVDRVTAPHGLAAPGGVVSPTGVAGLALSGGVSRHRRLHGMTIDNLVSAEVVTADGRRLRAAADEHPDLYWALRGGGGNFGVVTSFEFRAHPVGPEVYALVVYYPLEHSAAMFKAWRDAVADAPDELSTEAWVWVLPDVPELPEELRALPVCGVSGMYTGPVEEGERLTRALREIAPPLLDMSGPVPFIDLQSTLDPFFPDGLRYYWKALYLDGFSDQVVDDMVDWTMLRPSVDSLMIVRHLGGAMSRVGAEETAFGDRDSEWMLSIDATWREADGDARNIAWTRDFWQAMHRHSSGKTYFNFPGLLEEGDAAIRDSYGANHARLAAVKAAYDPENVFRGNQNIKPAH